MKEGGNTGRIRLDGNISVAREYVSTEQDKLQAKVKAAEARTPHLCEMFDQFKDGMNTQALLTVFEEYTGRSGVDHSQLNTDGALSWVPTIADTLFNTFTNTVELGSENHGMASALRSFERSGHLSRLARFRLEHDLIHEMCHAFSAQQAAITGTDDRHVVIKNTLGYAEHGAKEWLDAPTIRERTKEYNASFVALNEAMTERLAREIFIEYHKRTGQSEGARQFMLGLYRNESKNDRSYQVYMGYVDEIVRRVSKYSEVPESAVRTELYRGYFNHQTLRDPEIEAGLTATFGPHFIDDFAKLSNDTRYKAFRHFESTYGMPTSSTHLQDDLFQRLSADAWPA
jgi:hypothetical protein